MQYLHYVRSEAKSDDADAVLVTVLVMFPLMFLLIGFSLDFSKNVVIRSDLEEIALESVNAAIRAQDGVGNIICKGGTGWLDRNSAIGFVNSGSNDETSAKIAIKSYLMKTGRAESSDFAGANDDDLKDTLYNGKTDEESSVALRADSQQVSTFRSIVRDMSGPVKDDETPATAFRIRVTCGNADKRKNKLSNGEQADINGGNAAFRGVTNSKSDMITMDVKDWTGNFILGNPLAQQRHTNDEVEKNGVNLDSEIGFSTSSVNVQRFNITRSAITTWSQSALNEGKDSK